MNDNTERPNPDELLARVQKQENTASKGRLKIYFGSSAGVGKTFAMLNAAHRAQQEGLDVVVGVIETHGRKETEALTAGLDHLPLRQMNYRGREFTEFDLDAALARRPALLLVDELAHSNIEGSRHPKRWQDVEELLTAGIDVWTTLNVQHLESLNDVVGGITGVLVSETLPDRIFDEADEVVLVDLPADELLLRLKAGKVYMPQQAEHAASSFFRKGNLMALREIALRRTADRVEDDVLNYRVEQSINRIWKTDNAILACIGSSTGAEHVVRSAAQLARQINTSWHAVYVETPARQQIAANQREIILNVLKLAEQLQAQTAVLTGDNIARALVRYARQHNLSCIVIGHDTQRRSWPWQHRVGDDIAELAPDLDLMQIGKPEKNISKRSKISPAEDTSQPQDFQRYIWSGALCLLTALVATPLLQVFDLANIVMLFLLTVMLIAVRFGRGPSVFAAVLNVALFDFFFVPPRFTFAVSDVQYLFTFFIMLTVGLITGQLTSKLRFQARIASLREERSQMLFEFARDLSGALQVEQVVETSIATVQRAFGGQAALVLPDLDERLQAPQPQGQCEDIDQGIAQWAFDKNEQAGFATDTLPSSEYRYIPLRAPVRIRGILAIKPNNKRWLMIPEQQRQLETLASLIAMALERVHFVDISQDMLVRMESERLRNSLLAAISHDLRTPLTALTGFAESLSLSRNLAPEKQQEIVQAIRESATRMHTLVNNLLDMARIQSGEIRLKKDWYSLEEIVGSAIRSLEPLLASHRIITHIPADLPLVEMDAVLIERVLANLLENAAKYTPTGTAVTVSALIDQKKLIVSVSDNGPGFPPVLDNNLFDKFTRGESESATSGAGLGLAICKAIVEAHHGKISAHNHNDVDGKNRGAAFVFELPWTQPPVLEPDDSDVREQES
ncbi:MAG TPA: two-component system sensor histidine kinase KdpD [Pseudomonadales bacterium]|nr:two-component system sensor histidine kinase KdpD [Pseudomonadales bacterium]